MVWSPNWSPNQSVPSSPKQRAMSKQIKVTWDELLQENGRLSTEIERLRQEAANYKHALFSAVENVHKPQMADAKAEIERLRAQRDELLAALKAIAENDYRELTPEDFARAAIAKAEDHE